jgi:hypothetical protein
MSETTKYGAAIEARKEMNHLRATVESSHVDAYVHQVRGPEGMFRIGVGLSGWGENLLVADEHMADLVAEAICELSEQILNRIMSSAIARYDQALADAKIEIQQITADFEDMESSPWLAGHPRRQEHPLSARWRPRAVPGYGVRGHRRGV